MSNKKFDFSPLSICLMIVICTICLLAIWQNVKISSELLVAIISSLLTYFIVNKATNGNVIVETLPLISHQEQKE